MLQYMNASDSDFQQLQQRCQQSCIRIHSQLLPPGCSPTRAIIGLERDPDSGMYRLLVERGVTYSGKHAEIADWLRRAKREFSTFNDLKHWIRNELAQAYGDSNATRSTELQQQVVTLPELQKAHLSVNPAELTDLDAVAGPDNQTSAVAFLRSDEMSDLLCEQVRGQEEALSVIARRTCTHLARVRPRRPATMMLIGPTGVGKTKTAEILPLLIREMTDRRFNFEYVRIDMNEYQEAHRISQLLGAPQGYVGYGEGSQLLDVLARSPRSVVLFDEIEKAHPRIFQTLMNAMDAGRISSPSRSGRSHVIDCKQAIFVFTSNLNSERILDELNQHEGTVEPEFVNDICRRSLKQEGLPPEIIGRISTFAVFRTLSHRARVEILTQAIATVADEYGLQLQQISPSVISSLLAHSSNNSLGARPLEYLIDEHLGEVFRCTAFQRVSASGDAYELCGPPFECFALDSDSF